MQDADALHGKRQHVLGERPLGPELRALVHLDHLLLGGGGEDAAPVQHIKRPGNGLPIQSLTCPLCVDDASKSDAKLVGHHRCMRLGIMGELGGLRILQECHQGIELVSELQHVEHEDLQVRSLPEGHLQQAQVACGSTQIHAMAIYSANGLRPEEAQTVSSLSQGTRIGNQEDLCAATCRQALLPPFRCLHALVEGYDVLY
mmetsp:Transcript_83811/g.151230  ORF Transcript_83811/g.151230 Transcript_83811/m.151230 type:complete len:202 (-) Transcript_83811:296-901(-)